MANKVLLKKSSVGARVPLVGDLDYGELALNYADGKLYYKTSANAIDLYPSATATATLTNKTLTSPVLGGITVSASGNIVLKPFTNILEIQGDGSTVGQIQLNCPVNTHGQRIASQPHSASATNTLTLPGGSTIGNADAVLVSDTGTQTLTNKTIAAGSNTISGLTNSNLSGTAGITNANLANSSITINGSAVSLGGTVTVTATATNALTIGTGLSGTSYNGSSAVTIAIDSTVATLTGTQTLTNKTLTSPTLTTPALGVATATSINKVAFTAPATGSTLTIADGKTLTASNSLTFTGTDSTSFAFPGTSDTVVTLTATQTLTNKTLTTPIISSISNTGTLTLPTSTDTLVGRATTDTLTNKTLSSGVLTGTLTAGGGVGTNGQVLQSTSTGVQWATVAAGNVGTVTSITAGTGLTGGTITSSGTIAIDSTVATLTGTQTLTNKSLTSPIVTGTITAGGAVGEDGQVLTSTGTGVYWTTPAAGAGGTGNSFTTIAVSGQSSVLADSATDTLTLAAAGVIGVITSPSTDTITFTTNKSFPFTKYDGNASNIPLFTEASALATSLDTVYLPFAKSDGTSVTTLKLTA
jgi:hypothetical protein